MKVLIYVLLRIWRCKDVMKIKQLLFRGQASSSLSCVESRECIEWIIIIFKRCSLYDLC